MYRFAIHLIALSCVLLLGLFSVTTATYAQTAGISSPAPGQTVNGIVFITGTTTDPNFSRYEIAFLQEVNLGLGWVVFADGDQQVVNGNLAVWDTTVGQNSGAPIFPDGAYQLRLRVVRQDLSYAEYFVGNITVQNNTPVEPLATLAIATPELSTPPTEVALPPSLTPEFTAIPTAIPTATPLPTRIEPTLIATPDPNLPPAQEGELLPTLTPFPTSTPAPTEVRENPVIAEVSADSANELVEDVLSIDSQQFGRAFRQGMLFTIGLFGLFGLYLLIRAIIRWIWRLVSANW